MGAPPPRIDRRADVLADAHRKRRRERIEAERTDAQPERESPAARYAEPPAQFLGVVQADVRMIRTRRRHRHDGQAVLRGQADVSESPLPGHFVAVLEAAASLLAPARG